MSLSTITSTLLKPEIKQMLLDAGMVHLRIFGSTARGEAHKKSDIDLLYEFDNKQCKSPRGVNGIEGVLESTFHKNIDLVNNKYIHPNLEKSIFSSIYQVY